MELTELVYFTTIAQTGNMSRAAKKIAGITARIERGGQKIGTGFEYATFCPGK